jgi:hypothetical protein
MKRSTYMTRALKAHDPRFARVLGKLGYERSDMIAADPLDQIGVVGGAQADIVGEKRGAGDVVVAVHRVRTPDKRDLHRHVGGEGGVVIAVRQGRPFGDGRVLVHGGPGAAAIQHRADVILGHLFGRDVADVRLGHLTDLLRQGHARHDPGDPRLHGGVRRVGGGQSRPVRETLTGGGLLADGAHRRKGAPGQKQQG